LPKNAAAGMNTINALAGLLGSIMGEESKE